MPQPHGRGAVEASPCASDADGGSVNRRLTGFPPTVREIIKNRAGNRCEYCGGWDQYLQLHHRRPRQSGGSRREDTNQPSNGVALCMACHEGFEMFRTDAYESGWLLRQHQTPTEIPLTFPGGRRFLLGDDGGMYEIPGKAA